MNDKILITGANGQLGTELAKLLPEAVLTDVADLDITDFQAVQSFVQERQIKTIINAAAYTAVDKAEDEPSVAHKINVQGPENLAKTVCKIIHISTDYVFDGTNHQPYRPEDKTNSPYGNNFVKTMRRLGAERDTLNVVADQIGTPTYAADLAKAIKQILPQLNEQTKGIYHFTNEGVCSWYDFAVEIMRLSKLSCKVLPMTSAEYPTKAQRPFYSVLDKNKIKKTFHFEIPHWKESLEQCLKQF